MRTTVTLDADTEQIVRSLMRERGVSFKRALNDVIRRGAATGDQSAFRTKTASMGRSTVPLDRALALAADMEDEELLRRMSLGS
jgi:type II secretory pathway component PulF